MSSILTNMSAMSAVANLAATQKSLSETQSQISTGLKVASAKDNAAYYSIATTMRASVSNLSTVKDSLNLGTSVISTATAALNSMTSILTKIQSNLTSAQQAGTDKVAIGTEIKALQAQLQTAIGSASFNNVNLLDGNSTSAQFVSSVTGTGAKTKVNYLSIDTATTNFGTTAASSKFAITVAADTAQGTTAQTVDITSMGTGTDANLLAVGASTSAQTLTNYIAAVGAAIDNVTTASSTLGAAQKNIDLQSTFIAALTDSITTGIGSLVDADMNEASTRLNALQTQQQLGVQALAIANQNSQLILKLFQ